MLRFVISKIRAKKWMMFSLIIGNILLIAIACVNPMYTRAVLQKSMLNSLADEMELKGRYPGTVTVTASLLKLKGSITNQENFLAIEDASQSLDEDLGVPFKEYVTQYSISNVKMQSTNLRSDDAQSKRATLCFLSNMDDHIDLIAGSGMGKSVDAGVIDVIVSEKGLLNMNLLVGEVLQLEELTDAQGNPLSVRVAGVFTNNRESDPYWVMTPTGYSSSMLMDEQLFRDLFVDFGENQRIDLRGTWYALMDYTLMNNDDAQHYIDHMAQLRSRFPTETNTSITNNFSIVLESFIAEGKKVSATLLVLQAPIFALLAVFIFMVSRQLLTMEESEISVLKSRGAGRTQIITVYLLQSTALAVVAFAAGLPLSVWLCQVLGSANAFLQFVSRSALPARIDLNVLLCGLAAAVFSVLTMVLPVLQFAKVSIVNQKQSKRKQGMPWWQKIGLDFVLLAVSLYGLYNYGSQKDLLVQKVLEGQMLDPLLFLCAPLFIIGCGLVALRILPLIVRLVYQIGKKWWSPALFASFLQVLRTKGSQGFIMVFLMFTIALGLFNATAARTINENEEKNIRYGIGADIVLAEAWQDNSSVVSSGPDASSTTTEESSLRYVEPEYEGYTLLPQAASVTKVLNDADITLSLPSSGMLKGVRLMGINTKEFGNTAWFDESLLPTHWYHYLNAISQNAEAVLVSENFEEYGYKLGDVLNYRNSAGKSTRGVIYGFVPYWPTYNAVVSQKGTDNVYRETNSYLIVAHLSQVQSAFGITPYQVWIKTQDESTQFIYDYIEQTDKKLRVFNDTTASIIEMKNKPVFQGTNGILTVGFIVVLMLCTVGFLIYWVLSIRQRALQMGILRAMGMSMREIISMLVNEQVWISGLSIAAGVGIGIAAAQLYMPIMQIAYAASDQMVPLSVVISGADCARLLAIVALVMVVCLCVLGVIVSRMKIVKALKLGED